MTAVSGRVPDDRTLIKFSSHRGRERLTSLVPDIEFYYSWDSPRSWSAATGLCSIPTSHVPDAIKIPGVTVSRFKGELHRPWSPVG